MLNIGSRSNPSVLNLVLIVIVIIAAADYMLFSLDTEDWSWFSNRFAETPQRVIVHCYGRSINIERSSSHFSALAEMMNKIMSGQKHYNPLSLSLETYQEYQQSPGMVTIEFIYPAGLRVQSDQQYYSSVDNLVVPLGGRHAQIYAFFGQNQGVPTAGSLLVESTERLNAYLRNQKICLTAASTLLPYSILYNRISSSKSSHRGEIGVGVYSPFVTKLRSVPSASKI